MTKRLEDREAIRDVIAAYAHAIDRRRWDMMPQLFHADATFGFGPVQGSWQDFVGQAQAIIDGVPHKFDANNGISAGISLNNRTFINRKLIFDLKPRYASRENA